MVKGQHNFHRDGLYVYLLTFYRSAARSYEMVWVFKNGRYVRRYVDQSND
jgi:hypothetical protein